MSQKMNEVKEWLEKAEQDLVTGLLGEILHGIPR